MAEEMRPGGGAAMNPATPPCANGQIYTVKPGDTMYMIARQFNITLSTLVAANPQIADPNMIFPGQMICVPVPTPLPVACPGGFSYTVQRGDTLFAIARRYGVSLDALKAANPQIANPDLIFPGQSVCVPGVAPPMPVPCPGGHLHTVRPGDTMFDIATRSGVTLQALIAANPQIADPNMIFPGQMICVPAAPTGPMLPAPVTISPVVSPVAPPMPVAPHIPAGPAVPPMPVMPEQPPYMPMPFAPGMPAMPPCPMPIMCPFMGEPMRRRCRHHKHHHHHDEPRQRPRRRCCFF